MRRQRTVEIESHNRLHSLKIDDNPECGNPAHNGALYKTVSQQNLRRTPAGIVDQYPLQIAQDAQQDKETGHIQVIRTKTIHHIVSHRVHDITNHCHRGHNNDGGVQKWKIQTGDIVAYLDAGLIVYKDIVPAFGESQEERQQESHQDNPMRQRGMCGHRTGENAEYKAQRHDEHIGNSDSLESQTVGNIQKDVNYDNG